MRNKNLSSWPKKGQTDDHGAGSRAKVISSGLNEAQQAQVASGYDAALAVINGLPEDVQRCIGFALASDFSLPAITEKSNETPAITVIKVDVEAWARVASELGDKRVSGSVMQALFEKHKGEVQAQRKLVRETAAAE